jgi:hypothetical protein
VPRPIRLVVACADTKKLPPKPIHRYARLRRVAQDRRLNAWIESLETTLPGMSARHVYAGVYWTAVKATAEDLAATQGTSALSILSAGYGLLDADAPIHPYAATFSVGSEDSIPPSHQLDWWRGLSHWSGPLAGASRSIKAMVSSHDEPAIVLVASPAYLKAIAHDLAEATYTAQVRRQPFIVVSTGARNARSSFREFDWAIMRSDARLEQLVGVGKVALNARIADYLIKVAEYDGDCIDMARMRIEEQCDSLPPQVAIKRRETTDERVQVFIRKELRKEPGAPFTRLLRTLRNSGVACEYKRFRALYDHLRSEEL